MKDLSLSPPTGDNFGKRGIELAGIIVDPTSEGQKHGTGTDLVKIFVNENNPDTITAYTRNPGVLRILGEVGGGIEDVLRHEDPEAVAAQLEYASVHEGIAYHLDRYGPNGLYGSYDPAERKYNGVPLKERAVLLENPNHALAVSVDIPGAHHE